MSGRWKREDVQLKDSPGSSKKKKKEMRQEGSTLGRSSLIKFFFSVSFKDGVYLMCCRLRGRSYREAGEGVRGDGQMSE